jgi:hypothetical protein
MLNWDIVATISMLYNVKPRLGAVLPSDFSSYMRSLAGRISESETEDKKYAFPEFHLL